MAAGISPSASRPGRALAALALFAPGFLLGVHLAGLLFFLNPELPFAALPVARAALVYGTLLGAASALVGLPFALRRPRRAVRFLPWGVTVALALAAVLDSAHASHFAFYLPPGINERLIKAALWMALAALIAFYTALLHSLRHRRYGRRSRMAFWFLALVSVYLMVERREAFTPRPDSARPTGIEAAQRPFLLVVGLDSATLDALLPMAEEGRLPFFAALLREGAYGRLGTFAPDRTPTVWATLATGKYPYKTGVVGNRAYPASFVAPGARLHLLPAGLGFEHWGLFGERGWPEDGGSVRRVQALWEILPKLGVSSGVVGWPAASASAPGPEFVFTDRFFGSSFQPDQARPETLAERAWIFRIGVGELDPAYRSRFAPVAPPALLRALALDVWRESLTRFLDQQQEARAVFLRLPGLAVASKRYFGGYSEYRFAAHHAPVYERSAAALGAYYAQLDSMLSDLWGQIDGPRLLAVVSGSGVDEPGWLSRAWLAVRGQSAVGGDLRGAPDGVVLLLGEGIRADTLITGADLVDVAPTLLYGLGLPVARDLDGRVLTEAFSREFLKQHPLTFVPSYETLESEPRRGVPAP